MKPGMRNGRIPPNESHPHYHDWLQASIRHLKAARRLRSMSQSDPEYAATLSEWQEAEAEYEGIAAII